MLLFKPEHVPMILAGTKTQTRRTWRRWRVKVGSVHEARTSLFGKPFALLRIVSRREERLGNISEADTRAEGYASVADYREVFERIYGWWDPDEVVKVIDFEVVGEGAGNAAG